MKKTQGIEILELSSGNGEMYPTLIYDEYNVLLIDTGLPTQMDALTHQLKRFGFDLTQLTALLITHHDMDHMGNLLAIKTKCPKLEVFAHRLEIPYIDGTLTHLKIQDIETGKITLKPEQHAWVENLKSSFPALVCPVDLALEDKDVLEIARGLEVIATPGHTLGHISLYHAASKTLISGDALNIKDGQLSGPNPRFTHDMDQALDSIRKLLAYDISRVILYHGGLIEGDHLEAQLRNLVNEAPEREITDEKIK